MRNHLVVFFCMLTYKMRMVYDRDGLFVRYGYKKKAENVWIAQHYRMMVSIRFLSTKM